MFTKSCREMIERLPYMTDRRRYEIWRRRIHNDRYDTFGRMAWLGDEVIKQLVTAYLYENTDSKAGADACFLSEMRAALENRWAQLVITLSLGLDEEMDPPLQPLIPNLGGEEERIKLYADILEAYIGGLSAMDRPAVDQWISTLIRRFFRDLLKMIEKQLPLWGLSKKDSDATCFHLKIEWRSGLGPVLILWLRRRNGRGAQPRRLFPLLENCFSATAVGHDIRWLPHPPATEEYITRRRPRDTFASNFRRNAKHISDVEELPFWEQYRMNHPNPPPNTANEVIIDAKKCAVFSSKNDQMRRRNRPPNLAGTLRMDALGSRSAESSGSGPTWPSHTSLPRTTMAWRGAETVDLTSDAEADEVVIRRPPHEVVDLTNDSSEDEDEEEMREVEASLIPSFAPNGTRRAGRASRLGGAVAVGPTVSLLRSQAHQGSSSSDVDATRRALFSSFVRGEHAKRSL